MATRSTADCYGDVYHVVGCEGPGFDPQLDFVERLGPIAPLRFEASDAARPLAPGDCDASGCAWPSQTLLQEVPDSWSSGLYIVQFTASAEPAGRLQRLGQDAVVVVRPKEPHEAALVQVGIATWSAYHLWGNRNLYGGLDETGGWHWSLRGSKVSMRRPGIGLGPFNQTSYGPPKSSYLWKFIQWASEEGLQFDYCTGIDIGCGSVALRDYRLLVTLGHDEYWSGAQRDRVEEFTARGGNAAFFGGNLAYWQVRLEDDGETIVCHKRGPASVASVATDGDPLDPLYRNPVSSPNHDNSKVTVEFDSKPVLRPTRTLTGVSMRNDEALRRRDPDRMNELSFCGATWWWEDLGGPSRPQMGFRVDRPEHWVFDGLELSQGDEFGAEQSIVGFECDGLDVVWDAAGQCVPNDRGSAMPGTVVLAHADCRSWAEVDYSATPPRALPGCRASDAALGGVVTMVSSQTSGGGQVVTAPTTDWVFALVPTLRYTDYRQLYPTVNDPSGAVRSITRTIIVRLCGGDAATPDR